MRRSRVLGTYTAGGLLCGAVPTPDDFHCSFCGRRRTDVRKLIAGPRVFICDRCVELCLNILQDNPERASSRRHGTEDHQCSFCGKRRREVPAMIDGPTVLMCNECVALCEDIVVDALGADWRARPRSSR